MNSQPRRRRLSAVPDLEEDKDREAPRFETASRFEALTTGADPFPDSLRLEMARASRLWESLDSDGKQLRYEVDEATGRVSVELRDKSGTSLRVVPLAQALGAGDEDDSPAA